MQDSPGSDSFDNVGRHLGSVWNQLRIVEDFRMLYAVLRVAFVPRRQMLPGGAHTASADDQ